MTTTQGSAELRAPVPNSPAYQDYDEIDLVDIIGFFWRSRAIVAASIVGGVLIAGGIWFVKGRADNVLPHAAPAGPTVWSARIGAENGDEAALAAVPQQLSSFIKTTAGARAFYESLALAADRPRLNTEALVSKQVAGQGMLKSLEIRGAEMVVTVEDTGLLQAKEMKVVLPVALNQTVAAFNKNFADVQASLMVESLNAQLKLGETKLRALKLFDRYAGLSAPLKAGCRGINGLSEPIAALRPLAGAN